MNQRNQRVTDLIRNELSTILQRDVRDPRVRLASITSLEVSRDLSHARVRISVLGDEDDREQCVEALKKAKGFIRSLLARRVRLRTVPDLHFELDRGAEHSQFMHALLSDLNVPEETPGPAETPESIEAASAVQDSAVEAAAGEAAAGDDTPPTVD